jgi:RNA polymerase sigma-70 factor (ECF subfamily)
MDASNGQRTNAQNETTESLILAARTGSRSAFEHLVDRCYDYLQALARNELTGTLQTKLSGSDLVQDTLVEAERCFADFRGSTQQELISWLRRILLNNLADAHRRYCQAAKREAGREVPLPQKSGDTDSFGDIASDTSTPSQRAVRMEDEARVCQALLRLPDDRRAVIEYRHRDGLSFAEIGRRMNRSPDAVRHLWARAIDQLRGLLERDDGPR